MQFIQFIPSWVFLIFVLLLWFGLAGTKDRHVPWRMPILVPVGMSVWAVSGLLLSYKNSEWLGFSLAIWAGVSGLLVVYFSKKPFSSDFYYDATTRRFAMPGSWMPMAIYMGIFLVKFAVGMLNALQPALTSTPEFVLGVSAVYGLFSGRLLANAWRFVRLRRSALHLQPELPPKISG